jgi:ketosteroid isomerase-like protein
MFPKMQYSLRMEPKLDPLAAERAFFAALISANLDAIDSLLTDDFLLIDVLSGAEITKPMLLAALGSSQAKFDAIEPIESRLRIYATDTAVVTGRTELRGRVGEAAFTASSRYTHVFVMQDGGWVLASAQGTQIR